MMVFILQVPLISKILKQRRHHVVSAAATSLYWPFNLSNLCHLYGLWSAAGVYYMGIRVGQAKNVFLQFHDKIYVAQNWSKVPGWR